MVLFTVIVEEKNGMGAILGTYFVESRFEGDAKRKAIDIYIKELENKLEAIAKRVEVHQVESF